MTMKKLIALLLALVMLSVTAVSLGETVEEDAFEKHLNAFLSSLDLQNKDLTLAATQQDTLLRLVLGMNDEGTLNLMFAQNGEPQGSLQFDQEALYLTQNGSTMAVRMETLQNFFSQLPQKVLGLLTQMGVDFEKISADLQTAVGLLQQFAAKLAPAIQQGGEAPEMILSLDSEAFGTLLGEAIDALLADESFAKLVQDYAPLFGAQADLEQLRASWQENKDAVVAVAQTLKAQVTVNSEAGDFNATCSWDPKPGLRFSADFIGKMADRAMIVEGVMIAANGQDEYRIEMSETMEKTSFLLNIPTKVTQHVVMTGNGEEIVKQDMSLVLSEAGNLESFQVSQYQKGELAMKITYADNEFAVYGPGEQEMLYIQYQTANELLLVRVAGTQITFGLAESDANHKTYVATINQGEQEMKVFFTCAILEEEGQEYLRFTVTSGEQTLLAMEVVQVEKIEFPALKDDETVNWITEEMLDQLFLQMVGQALGSGTTQE